MRRVAIGIDLGGTNMRMGVVSADGTILASSRSRAGVQEGVDKVLARIAADVSALRARMPETDVLSGIGIGVPGIISAKEGIVRFSPNLPGWVDVPLRSMLEQMTGTAVTVENDANAYALGEHRFGAGRGSKSMVCITLGTGVGGGIILDGKIVRGADGMAGEVGHITVRPAGIKCGCGNRGCVERYASATAVAEAAKSALAKGSASSMSRAYRVDPGSITAQAVHEAASAGDPLAKRIFRDAGASLGIVIAGLINLLNMETVVVGGGMSGAWEFFYGPMTAEVAKRAFRIPAARCRILRGELGDDAAVLGAAGISFGKKQKGQ